MTDTDRLIVVESKPEEIIKEMISYYEEKTDRTLAESDVDRMLINLLAYRESLVLAKTQRAFEQNFIQYARGQALDVLGKQKDILRLDAVAAEAPILFKIQEPLNFSVNIPEGTTIKSEKGLLFKTKTALVVSKGQISVFGRVVCLEKGTVGNGLEIGSINKLTNPIAYVHSVENTAVSGGGGEKETDDRYKNRLLISPDRPSVAGPSDLYRYLSLSAHPDVIDAFVDSPSPCVIEIYLLINNNTPNEVAQFVQDYMRDDVLRPTGDRVSCFLATPVEYEINTTVDILNNVFPEIISAKIENSLISLTQEWKRNLGQKIIPSKIIEVQSAIDGVEKVNEDPTEYLILSKKEYPICTSINISMVTVND